MSDSPKQHDVPRLYRLSEAAKLFFPNTGITSKALRNEARHGRLQIVKVGGRLFVTSEAIVAMLERCILPAGESLPSSTRDAPHGGLSIAEREKQAQAALRLMLSARTRRSKDT